MGASKGNMTEKNNKIKIDLSKIQVNKDNPRLIKDDKFKKLVKSIKEFPEMLEKRPIIVDEDFVVLGGNMRLKAAKEAGLKKVWIDQAIGWSDEKKAEFIIKDNVGFGEWDWEILANEWYSKQVIEWGLDIVGFDVNVEEYEEQFSLPNGDKEPFQQMTFTLANQQAEYIKSKLAEIKKTEKYKYVETFGNENSNGNALYLALNG